MNSMQSRRNIDSLTGARAIAAVWVLLFHYRDVMYPLFPALSLLNPVFQAGFLGVDFFFMLSGFILSYNYMDRFASGFRLSTYVNFVKLRFARIYPVHFLTLNLALLSWWGTKLFHVRMGGHAASLYTVESYTI